MNRILAVAALAAALPWARPVAAQEGEGRRGHPARPPTTICTGLLDPGLVVRCAQANSPEVAEAGHRLDAVAGRRTAAGVWLRSNPSIAATLSQRHRDEGEPVSVLNWALTLSQELELGGQRGARLAVADAEAAAQARRVAVAEQEIGAAALVAFFEAEAAQEARQFADDLVKSGAALAAAAQARAKEALLSGIEADVARAEAVRIGLLRAEAARRFEDSRTALALLLGQDPGAVQVPAFTAAGLSTPDLSDRAALLAQALRLRGEIGAAAMERRVLEAQLALHKRERIPNLTLSAFAERGEINDRILGLGLSVPLPLPAPVGRTRAGEIAETVAQIRAAESSTDLVRRRVRLEVARALAAFSARQAAGDLFAPDLLASARADLIALRDAVGARQLALREAVAWQRSLIELLQSDIETRLGRALAIVELRRVAGLPLVVTEGRAR
jgi:cobalt-zinc-cadmium efflux system outer membrane protein